MAHIDKQQIFQELKEMMAKAQAPVCPIFLNDERLEDAFKTPDYDSEGYSDILPSIWSDYSYGKDQDGVLYITLKSASVASRLYSQYLDEEALVWDSAQNRLLLYIPDTEKPRMAFKGGAWQFAKRLKPEYRLFLTERDIYCELIENGHINN